MIDRRCVLRWMGTGLAALPCRGYAQRSGTAQTIGFVAMAKRDTAQIEAFHNGLAEEGLVPGRAIIVEERYGDGSRERMAQSIGDLLAAGVRIFVASGPNIAQMIQQQSGDAAIVVASLETTAVAGVSGSIARPPANITGFATMREELIEKRVELLTEMIPGLRNILVVTQDQNSNHKGLAEAAHRAGKRLNVDIIEASLTDRGALTATLKRGRDAGAKAALFPRDYLFESIRVEIIRAALDAGIAADFDDGEFVRLGGFSSYSPSRPDLFRRSASYVAKMLAGAKPADLPIQQPTKFELVLNQQTAAALGITIPPSVLVRADEIIE